MPLPVLSIRCTFLTPEPPARSLSSSTHPPQIQIRRLPASLDSDFLVAKVTMALPLSGPHPIALRFFARRPDLTHFAALCWRNSTR